MDVKIKIEQKSTIKVVNLTLQSLKFTNMNEVWGQSVPHTKQTVWFQKTFKSIKKAAVVAKHLLQKNLNKKTKGSNMLSFTFMVTRFYF